MEPDPTPLPLWRLKLFR
ncbi:mgtA regulatory leader peptide MgtL [Escherichia coli]